MALLFIRLLPHRSLEAHADSADASARGNEALDSTAESAADSSECKNAKSTREETTARS